MNRMRLPCTLAASLFLGTATAQPATVHLGIPAGDATQALSEFRNTTRLSMLYQHSLVSGVQTNAIDGDFTPREGLARVPSGTKLQAHFSADGAFASIDPIVNPEPGRQRR